MDSLRFNSNGTDASYLANVNMFFSVLFTLQIFQNGWPGEKLGSQGVLQNGLDWFRQMFQGGLTGNRQHIAARKTARQDLTLRIQKILRYLDAVADEGDIAALVNSGVVCQQSKKRIHRTTKATVAQQA